jgi:hypothetical protein
MSKSYKKIPLERLEIVRLQVRADFKKLERTTGKRYSFRTFYLGPRKEQNSVYHTIRQGTTNKADAYAAKIAIYEVTGTYKDRDGRKHNCTSLMTYV